MEEWQNTTTIASWLLIVILFIGMLAGSTVLLLHSGFRQMQRKETEQMITESGHRDELLKTWIDASETEKQRIASDLHDHFGVSLSTLKLKLNQLYESPAEVQSSILPGIHQLLDKNIEDMRDLSHGIYPPFLKEWGIVLSLKEIAADLAGKAELGILSTGKKPLADEWTTLQLFRICQEFIHNSIRHGNARRITIHFRVTDNLFALKLEDNGCGFDPAHVRKGAGLNTIQNRCDAIGSVSRITSFPGKGTQLTLIKITV